MDNLLKNHRRAVIAHLIFEDKLSEKDIKERLEWIYKGDQAIKDMIDYINDTIESPENIEQQNKLEHLHLFFKEVLDGYYDRPRGKDDSVYYVYDVRGLGDCLFEALLSGQHYLDTKEINNLYSVIRRMDLSDDELVTFKDKYSRYPMENLTNQETYNKYNNKNTYILPTREIDNTDIAIFHKINKAVTKILDLRSELSLKKETDVSKVISFKINGVTPGVGLPILLAYDDNDITAYNKTLTYGDRFNAIKYGIIKEVNIRFYEPVINYPETSHKIVRDIKKEREKNCLFSTEINILYGKDKYNDNCNKPIYRIDHKTLNNQKIFTKTTLVMNDKSNKYINILRLPKIPDAIGDMHFVLLIEI